MEESVDTRAAILTGKKQFFLVWSPQGKTPPTFVHDTHGAALKAAATMATTHPGQDFFLMKAKAVFRSEVPGRYFNLKKPKPNGRKKAAEPTTEPCGVGASEAA